MTKKEELLRMYCDRMTDIERYVFYGKDGVLKAMEEYGKYCAEQAYKAGQNSIKVTDHTHIVDADEYLESLEKEETK